MSSKTETTNKMNSVLIDGVEIPIIYIPNPYKKKKKTIKKEPIIKAERFKYVNPYDYKDLLIQEQQGKIKIFFTQQGLKLVLLKYYEYE